MAQKQPNPYPGPRTLPPPPPLPPSKKSAGKSIRTIAELAKAVAILKTRDARRAREVKALQHDIIVLEERIPRRIPIVGETRLEFPTLSPATNSTEPSCLRDGSAHAGTALLRRMRSFFLWLRT